MEKYVLPIVIEKDEDGYFVFCPVLQGCYSQGDSYEEALDNIQDAIRLNIEDRTVSFRENPTSEGFKEHFGRCWLES